jgi:S1-C subfamily serine protease
MANTQQSIRITTQKNQHFSARYIFGNRQKDLALLYTPFLLKDCKVMELQQNDIVLGEEVLVFGYPVVGSVTVTRGIISGLNRTLAANDYMSSRLMSFSGLVQTDAAINGGNSGGPVVNLQNQLVGIVQLASIHCNDIGFLISNTQIREFLNDPYLQRLDRNLFR